MGTLLYSVGFTLILSLMAYFSFNHSSSERVHIGQALAINQLKREEFSWLISKKTQDLMSQKRAATRNTLKNTTGYLHVHELFTVQDSERQKTEAALFKNLLSILYKKVPFSSSHIDSTAYVQDLFQELRLTILSLDGRFQFTKLSHLADLHYSGPEGKDKEFILLTLLNGAHVEYVPRKTTFVPSLSDFIRAKQRKKSCMSVYKAPEELLLALFQDPAIVKDVLTARMNMHKKITSKQENNSENLAEQLSQEFRSSFESKIPSTISAQYIDFLVTKGMPRKSPLTMEGRNECAPLDSDDDVDEEE
jgi:hypothetical protein